MPSDLPPPLSTPGPSAREPSPRDVSAPEPSAPAAPGRPRGALPDGQRLRGFEIQRVLASSAATITYLATDEELAIVVVLKEYFPARLAHRPDGLAVALASPEHAEAYERGLRAFIDEARRLARSDHPSLIRVTGLWEAHGTAYRVMPHHDGIPLVDVRRAMQMRPDEAALRPLLDGLLGALEVYHRSGQAHGAVHPRNILLLPDDRPLLLGPGAAARAIASTVMESLLGEQGAGYAPAQQLAAALGEPLDPALDLQALAETLRFCISGEVAQASPPGALRRPPESFIELVQRLDGDAAARRYSVRFLESLEAAAGPEAARPRSVAQFREWLADSPRAGSAAAPLRAGPAATTATAASADATRATSSAVADPAARAPVAGVSPVSPTPAPAALAASMVPSPVAASPTATPPAAPSPAARVARPAVAEPSPGASATAAVALPLDATAVPAAPLPPGSSPSPPASPRPAAAPATRSAGTPSPAPSPSSSSSSSPSPSASASTPPSPGDADFVFSPAFLEELLAASREDPAISTSPPHGPAARAPAFERAEPRLHAVPSAAPPFAAAADPSPRPLPSRRKPVWAAAALALALLVAVGAYEWRKPTLRYTGNLPADALQAADEALARSNRQVPPGAIPPASGRPADAASTPGGAADFPLPGAPTAAGRADAPLAAQSPASEVAGSGRSEPPAGAERAAPPAAEGDDDIITETATDAPTRATSGRAAVAGTAPGTSTGGTNGAARNAARAESSPRQVCGDRSQFALYRCMQTQCALPRWSGHAQCQQLRVTDSVE